MQYTEYFLTIIRVEPPFQLWTLFSRCEMEYRKIEVLNKTSVLAALTNVLPSAYCPYDNLQETLILFYCAYVVRL